MSTSTSTQIPIQKESEKKNKTNKDKNKTTSAVDNTVNKLVLDRGSCEKLHKK